MSEQWKYQIRIYLDGDLAEAARFDPRSQKLKWLSSVLAKHRAKLRCQFDLFAEYVAEAERVGTEAIIFTNGPGRRSKTLLNEQNM
jgi:hypothetical protein